MNESELRWIRWERNGRWGRGCADVDFDFRPRARGPKSKDTSQAEIDRELREQIARLGQEEVKDGSTSERAKDT
jgi:hypothetical protein